MLELLEIIFGILEICDDHQCMKEAKARRRASADRLSGQAMPDSNRMMTGHGGGPASIPYPYADFDQWHSM